MDLDMSKTLCLTVRQPWAWALFHGKPAENRLWLPLSKQLSAGDWLLIHASYEVDDADGWEACADCIERDAELEGRPPVKVPSAWEIERGGIIGALEFVGVFSQNARHGKRRMHELLKNRMHWLVDGQRWWVFDEAVLFPAFLPCPGALGLWPAPARHLEKIGQGIRGTLPAARLPGQVPLF
jgi:hypothetical protein